MEEIRKMKDESNRIIIIEFAGLKSKLPSGLVVKALDFQSRTPVFKTTG